MVVDIQGVGDLYTDPQVHSVKYSFGPGDMGPRGFRQFFRTHRCGQGLAKAGGCPVFCRVPVFCICSAK